MRTSHTLERIADNAVHVSKSTVLLSAQPYFKPLVDIQKISALAIGMVKDSLDVYLNLDIEKAKKISKRDQKVDAIYADIFKELIAQMHKDPEIINQALTFLFVCRRLERIADHSTHICEGAIYVCSGEYVDLNR
jgi:phosphate transport system protein